MKQNQIFLYAGMALGTLLGVVLAWNWGISDHQNKKEIAIVTTVQPIAAILKDLLDNGCDPSVLGNLELAIAWELLENERLLRQQTKEPMQGAIE